jgi:hypothetical protein
MRPCRPFTLLPAALALLLVPPACGADPAAPAPATDAADAAADPGAATADAPAADPGPATDAADAAADPDAATADVPAADPGPATASCNTLLQEGCQPTENCTYATTEATTPSCAPEGTKLYGQECAGLGDCQRGICLDLNDTGSRCYKFCKTEIHCIETVGPDALGFTGACAELSGVGFKVCGLDVTYQTCDLLTQGCDAGKGCYLLDQDTVCLPAGAAATGESCASTNDCAPGGICVGQRCKRSCDTAAADPCGAFVPCPAYWGSAGYCDE